MNDIIYIFQWWFMLFIIGVVFLPISYLIFSRLFDFGYIFSKILGIAIISYTIFILGTIHLIPFGQLNSVFIILFFSIFSLYLVKKKNLLPVLKSNLKIFLIEELIFLAMFLFWAFIRAHQPDIHGIEKYMNFGFVNTILRSDFFPPKDMWFTPSTINYYYFGHLVTAVLTKISGISSLITFNLMLATIFSFIFTGSFSIAVNLISQLKNISNTKLFIGSLLTAFMVTMAGNLQTIYAFFTSYKGDSPIPFWQLTLSLQTFPNSYWYASATRFIYHAIHEFPFYSLALSDLHAHLLATPFTLLAIAILYSIFLKLKNKDITETFLKLKNVVYLILLAFILSVCYMTNAWDGITYFLLTVLVFSFFYLLSPTLKKFYEFTVSILITGGTYLILILPFNLFYKPFISGVGILCPPKFLTSIGSIGPFLFETNTCQRSAFWELLILYGFLYFGVITFTFYFLRKIIKKDHAKNFADNFVVIFIVFSSILILIPELIYLKDIFTTYPRANTMWKVSYQAFIVLSLVFGYSITAFLQNIKSFTTNIFSKIIVVIYFLFGIFLFFFVAIYPFFAINSYYNGLKIHQGLDGTKYLNTSYPTDYNAITWLNKNIKGQPVILEAQGDSYTDYGRVSVNTGLPTVLGWTVHEWFWRNDYPTVAARSGDIKILYETKDLDLTKKLIQKYNISLIFVGELEKQKYTTLYENKFEKIGKVIYKDGSTKVYRINH